MSPTPCEKASNLCAYGMALETWSGGVHVGIELAVVQFKLAVATYPSSYAPNISLASVLRKSTNPY